MPFDLPVSIRATVAIAAASATLASPVAMKSEAFARIGDRLGGEAPAQVQQLSAGGYAFGLPTAWSRLGAAAAEAGSADSAGTVIAGACPGGSTGARCADGVQVTFISYDGSAGHRLPKYDLLRGQLDRELASRFRGYRRLAATTKTGAGGMRWLRYEFSFRQGGLVRHEVLAAYRRADGSGVLAVAVGPHAGLRDSREAVDEVLSSARDVRGHG